jgi:hypothetical protein
VQYGPTIAAVIVYLYAGQFLSRQRTAQALAELFGVPLSSGTVAALTARAAGRLGGFLEHVRGQIAAAEVAGFDETGFRVAGRLHWVHCARTGKYTLLMVHPKRGTEAMKAMGVLGSFAGVAVHDAWAPYDTYTGPEHQQCCAHALRELQAVTDAAPAGQWCRAAQAAEALTAMQDLVREAIRQGRDAVDPAALAAQVRLYRSAVLAGASQTAARSGPLMKKHHALARRLPGRQDDYPRFTPTSGRRPITTDLSATYGWPSCGKRYPAACAPSPAPTSQAEPEQRRHAGSACRMPQRSGVGDLADQSGERIVVDRPAHDHTRYSGRHDYKRHLLGRLPFVEHHDDSEPPIVPVRSGH